MSAQEQAIETKDAAERLFDFVNRIHEECPTGEMKLSQVISSIADRLGFDSYIDFLNQYLQLSRSVRESVEMIEFRRETARGRYLTSLDKIEAVFDAKNFDQRAINVLKSHYTSEVLGNLEHLSEALQNSRMGESSLEDLNDALASAQKFADFCFSKGEISLKMRKLIEIHLGHIRHTVDTYDSLGEQDFWNSYRILFSAFTELHEKVATEDADKEQFQKFWREMRGKLLLYSSLGANAVTLVTPITAFLS